MSDAAKLHKTVALAAHIGSQAVGKSFIDDQAAPLAALRIVVSGMVDAGALDRAEAEAAGKGLTIIAAKHKLEVQAQSDRLQLAAQKDVRVESLACFLDIASPRKISLSVAGGANITIDGNITIQCPGTITVLAGHKSFLAPSNVPYALPPMPRAGLDDQVYSERCRPWRATEALPEKVYAQHGYKLQSRSGVVVKGVLPQDGWSEPIYTPQAEPVTVHMTEFRIDQKITVDPFAAVESVLNGTRQGVTPGTIEDRMLDIAEGGH